MGCGWTQGGKFEMFGHGGCGIDHFEVDHGISRRHQERQPDAIVRTKARCRPGDIAGKVNGF